MIYRRETEEDAWPKRPILPGEDIADYILLRPSLLGRPGVLPLQALMVHRSIMEQVPFASHKDHEDWAWLLDAWHIAGARVEFCWEPLVVYNITTDSISRSRRMNWRDSMEWADSYRKDMSAAAYNSFLSTKVALKAKRAGDWEGLRAIASAVLHNKPGLLDIAFLLGMAMLPGPLLHAAWKRSLSDRKRGGKAMRVRRFGFGLMLAVGFILWQSHDRVVPAQMQQAHGVAIAAPVTRAFYGRRLEPKGVVLEGAGQSDETSFAAISAAMGSKPPMLSMSYVDLRGDLPAFFARLRTEMARYPVLIVPQIGLSMNGDNAKRHYEADVARGADDARLAQLCVGLKSLDRPVFLRLGYEFNGPWNGYEAASYVAAFRRVTEHVRACGLENVAMVWDWSPEAELDAENGGASAEDAAKRYAAFYPGDAWVDWWALNVFRAASASSVATKAFLADAERHRFPVMIAEATPFGHKVSEGWGVVDEWYAPFFGMVARNAWDQSVLLYRLELEHVSAVGYVGRCASGTQ